MKCKFELVISAPLYGCSETDEGLRDILDLLPDPAAFVSSVLADIFPFSTDFCVTDSDRESRQCRRLAQGNPHTAAAIHRTLMQIYHTLQVLLS